MARHVAFKNERKVYSNVYWKLKVMKKETVCVTLIVYLTMKWTYVLP